MNPNLAILYLLCFLINNPFPIFNLKVILFKVILFFHFNSKSLLIYNNHQQYHLFIHYFYQFNHLKFIIQFYYFQFININLIFYYFNQIFLIFILIIIYLNFLFHFYNLKSNFLIIIFYSTINHFIIKIQIIII